MRAHVEPTGARHRHGFSLLPRDERQALRLRRLFMASATALLLPLVVLAAAALGLAEFALAGWAAALVGAQVVLFYALIRSGLNLRFRDPSLTTEQIIAAIVSVAFVAHFATELRGVLSSFYLVALLFGVLRLDSRRLIVLSVIALLAHATALGLWQLRHPQAGAAGAALQLALLAMVLPAFAATGGFVSRLRVRLSDSNRRLTDALRRIETIAVRDELTGLYNRRFLLEVMAREAARARRVGASYAICLFDLDHFKKVNDTWGHAAGDAVLRHFAMLAADAGMRDVDVFGRLGGEEFLLVLPDTALPGAMACAERVRESLNAGPIPTLPPEYRISVTVGVARAGAGETPEALLARADRALYMGKSAGRNRVVPVN